MTTVVELSDYGDEKVRRADSLQNGYLPKEQLIVDPSVQFHSEYDDTIDPITYEVLKSKFWNLNWDHQETIRRAAGSLVVVQGYDFNSSIQTELGEGVVFGPGNLFFAGCADLVIQWTLEHRAGNIGINDGDIFIQDDPWVGTNHAMDTALYMPVFVEGRLFAWVYNVAHQRELGGIEPGGFVQSATDVFAESTFWPPVKIGENGALREDLMDAWVRRSRIPGMMTIEVKAQVAGVRSARNRLLELVGRYGPTTVKGGMQRVIREAAAATRERLSEIPDGEWRDVRYVAGAHPDDRNLYKICMSMKKTGDTVTVSNAGTDHWTGAFNMTAGVLRSAILSPMLQILAWDQQLCGAGVLRQLKFDFAPGAFNSAPHPAAVSPALGTATSIAQALYLTSKMMSGSVAARRHIYGASGLATLLLNQTFGIDRNGQPFTNFPFDGTNGGIGAFAERDGIHHGGSNVALINPVGSVEAYEQDIPFLYLYRRELPDSGGHGKFRGGSTYVTAWTGHKSEQAFISSGGVLPSVTQALGQVGGFPATGGRMWYSTDTSVVEEFAAGRLPSTPDQVRQVAKNGAPPPPKKFDNRLLPGDVFEVVPNPGAGHGEPLHREPEAVARDHAEGRVDVETARRIYGVVLTDGAVDTVATEQERLRQLRVRLEQAYGPRTPVAGAVAAAGKATETVIFGSLAGHDGDHFGCAGCSQALGPVSSGYRDGCLELDMALPAIAPIFSDPKEETGVHLVFRRYICPGCGVAVDGVICRPEDIPDWDVRLA